jgi:hypothetical protein
MQNKSIPDIEAAVVVAMVITLLLRPFEASSSMQQINLKVTSSDLKVILPKFFHNEGNKKRGKKMVTYLLLPELYGYRDFGHQCRTVLCRLDHQTTSHSQYPLHLCLN